MAWAEEEEAPLPEKTDTEVKSPALKDGLCLAPIDIKFKYEDIPSIKNKTFANVSMGPYASGMSSGRIWDIIRANKKTKA